MAKKKAAPTAKPIIAFRLPQGMLDDMTKVAKVKNISRNKLFELVMQDYLAARRPKQQDKADAALNLFN